MNVFILGKLGQPGLEFHNFAGDRFPESTTGMTAPGIGKDFSSNFTHRATLKKWTRRVVYTPRGR